MRTDHTPDDRRTDDRTIPAYDDPVDVALEVAQDLADDRDVDEYIRRARQARIAACELDDDDDDDLSELTTDDLLDDVTAEENPFNDDSHLYDDDETDDVYLEDGGTA